MTIFGAVILAAGDSTRIGFPKALLQWQGKSFLENIVETLQSAHIESIRVVTSAGGKNLIRDNLSLPGIQLVVNPDPSRGMFSSLKVGLQDFGVDVALICLVDHPKIGVTAVSDLKEACLTTDALAVIPRFEGKRGHPIAVKKELIHIFLQAPDNSSAKKILAARGSRVREIDTTDAGVIADIDTAADYERYLGEKFPRRT
ncbi:MAG: nucleotidyltransferase family protein [Acidobacteria bacterium]|nr:nucleotidyltransferase family protein [Acidobacteriota bacterium]